MPAPAAAQAVIHFVIPAKPGRAGLTSGPLGPDFAKLPALVAPATPIPVGAKQIAACGFNQVGPPNGPTPRHPSPSCSSRRSRWDRTRWSASDGCPRFPRRSISFPDTGTSITRAPRK